MLIAYLHARKTNKSVEFIDSVAPKV